MSPLRPINVRVGDRIMYIGSTVSRPEHQQVLKAGDIGTVTRVDPIDPPNHRLVIDEDTQETYPGRVGETFSTLTWRVHRYATSVRATCLLNAGKRGKQCDEFAVWRHGPAFRDGLDCLADIALRLACLAVDGIEPDEMSVEVEMAAAACGAESEHRRLRGIDVAPTGVEEEIAIAGEHVRVVADYSGDWSVLDTGDIHNEPTLIPLKLKDRKPFYAWAKSNAEQLKTMKFNDVMRALRLAGINYHYYCAVD